MGGSTVEEDERLGALWNEARAGHAAGREKFACLIRSTLASQASALEPDYRAMAGFSPDDLITRFTGRLLDPARRTVSHLDRQHRRFVSQYRTLSASGLTEDDLIEDYFCDGVFGRAAKSSVGRYTHAGGLVRFYS